MKTAKNSLQSSETQLLSQISLTLSEKEKELIDLKRHKRNTTRFADLKTDQQEKICGQIVSRAAAQIEECCTCSERESGVRLRLLRETVQTLYSCLVSLKEKRVEIAEKYCVLVYMISDLSACSL